MPLSFAPSPGDIVICDYSTGFLPPEMVKKRPVVVISPRRRAVQLVTVVPLSGTAPNPAEPWHVPVSSYPLARGAMWAKCDMVATVGWARLDRVMTRGPGGARQYSVPLVTPAELAAIMVGVKAALGIP